MPESSKKQKDETLVFSSDEVLAPTDFTDLFMHIPKQIIWVGILQGNVQKNQDERDS